MKKKLLSALLATVMTISLLSGCGSSEGTTEASIESDTAEAATEEKTESVGAQI